MNVRAQADADRRSPLPNMNDALSASPDKAQELKEAVCDALVNGIAAKVSGFGEFGEFVFGQRPRDQFTSALLLNQILASGEDESSDIRIAVHGASLKLKDACNGSLTVLPRFAVYVRVLPTWEDLDDPVLGLRPKVRLTRDAQREISADAKERTNAALQAGDKRDRNAIFAQNVRDVLQERGARFSRPAAPVVRVLVEEEPSVDQDDKRSKTRASAKADDQKDGPQDVPIDVAETVEGAEYPDELCIQEEIPLKFKRLTVAVPTLAFPLAAKPAERDKALTDHAAAMRAAIGAAYETYLQSQEGKDWAWRNVRLEPSAFRSKRTWEAALTQIRSTPARKERLWPEQQPELTLEWATNPTEPGIVHAAVGLLHRTCSDAGETYGDGGLYQVALSIEVMPADALIPYVLERIKPAYDIHGFHTIPAAGWNSGVTEERVDGAVRLNTTWCPRYILPRIVSNEIQDLDLSFDALADPQKDLAQLDLIPEEFDKWIEAQRNKDFRRRIPMVGVGRPTSSTVTWTLIAKR